MARRVRYGRNDNTVLRFALHSLWNSRCYWCQKPKDFNDIEIDHIIPRNTEPKGLHDLKRNYGLSDDFELDDPHNLAPICSQCNGPLGKGSRKYDVTPIILEKLQKARDFRSEVITQVLNFGHSKRAVEYLLKATEIDLGNPNSQRAFEIHAPAIVQKLALLNEAAADFTSFRTKTVTVATERLIEVGVSLNSRGRTAVAILQDVCRFELADAIKDPVIDLVESIHRDVHASFERIEGPAGPTNSGPPVSDYTRVDIDSIDYERWATCLEFTFTGSFDAALSASLVQDNWDGIGLKDFQGDAWASGTFSFDTVWRFSAEPGDVNVGDCSIDSREIDIDIDHS